MKASKQFDLHKPPHPTPIGGGSSNRLAYRELLAQTGEPRGSLFEPPKLGHKRKSRRVSAEESAAFVAAVTRDANPDHAFV